MNYAVEQRLRFIDFIVFHFGKIQRKHLQDYFGISAPCATRDFRQYNEMAPENLLYNVQTKSWVKADSFKRVFSGDIND